MRIKTTALIAALLLLAVPAGAHALELGISDTWTPIEQRNQWATDINADWERLVVDVGQTDAADRIRESHTADRKVILTIGGIGTRTRNPTASQLLAYIRSLPRADRYTVINEPAGNGTKPCEYRKLWMQVRRSLGRRLLFGDLDPYKPLSYTARVKRCGPLPKHLDFAVHPYQWTDPLAHAPVSLEGGIGNLGHIRRVLHGMGFTVDLWLTEFSYIADIQQGRARIVNDEKAAWMWPRAIKQARRNHTKVLVVYAAQGPSWDSRPGVQAWAAIRAHA